MSDEHLDDRFGEELTSGRGFGRYLPGLLVLLGGLGLGAALAYSAAAAILGVEMHRVVVPGATEVHLPAGRYTVFHEHHTTHEGRTYAQPEGLEGMRLLLARKDDGSPIAVEEPSGRISYSGSRAGVSVAAFELDRPGVIVVSGESAGPPAPDSVLAIGSVPLRRILVRGIGGILAAILGIVFGIILLVRTQRRAARAAASVYRPDMPR